MAAVLYIIGSLEDQVRASDLIGRGGLMFKSGELHDTLGTSLSKEDIPSAPVDRWIKVVQADAAREFEED